jgi:NADPH:quinone reductase-like Zn-dependent oxidoreductase
MSAAAVLGLIVDGGYASWVVAPQRAFYRVPDGLDAAQAAVLHCTAGTAFRGLARGGGLRAGMRALITGANGGVGASSTTAAASTSSCPAARSTSPSTASARRPSTPRSDR